MTVLPNPTLRGLREADALVRQGPEGPDSLSPDHDQATSFVTLGRRLFEGLGDSSKRALADGLSQIVAAQLDHFPDTIFWDFDYLAVAMVGLAREVGPSAVSEYSRDVAGLQRQYGCQSVICFRYVHDFTYGFDWAKWVRRDPQDRADVGPFDRRFVDYLMQRGSELEDLIAQNDEKYPKLPDGTPRNPFGFSREPGDERRLFVELARRDLLPVRTWEADTTPTWDRPFAELREELAREIGIPTP